MLLPVLRVMKPVTEHYRFLTVRHQDSLWKRHRFEAQETNDNSRCKTYNRLIYCSINVKSTG